MINGIIHRLGTGCQWHPLWSADGTWQRLLQHVQAVADAADDIEWKRRRFNFVATMSFRDLTGWCIRMSGR